MKLIEYKIKVENSIRRVGTVNTVLYIVNSLFSHLPVIIHKYYFFAQPLSEKKLLPNHRGSKILVVEVSLEQVLKLPLPRPKEIIKKRYKQGATCLSAFIDNEFAGCLWFVSGQYLEDEVRCLYKLTSDNSMFDFDVFVDPKYRLSPVFLRLWEEARIQLVQESKVWSFSRISAFNIGSLSSHERLGALVIGWSFFLGIGKNFQMTISNVDPFVHFSFNQFSFPVFKLNIPIL